MGTIGQKLDYLSDTKSILKQKINNLGGSLTDQSTFRSYGDYLDTLYNEMPKVTGEGTEITLTPTRKGKIQLDLKGNTEQAQLEVIETLDIIGGIITGDGTIGYGQTNGKVYILPCKPNNTYTIKKSNTTHRFSACDYPTIIDKTTKLHNKQDASASLLEMTYTTSEDANYMYIFGWFSTAGDTEDNIPIITAEIGINPDYPQPIHVVTGNNTISIGNTDYPINLGSLELCKIEDYQDYLYKENGNWYKYEVIYKAIRNGTESWINGTYGTNSYYHVNTAIKDIQSQAVILANLFKGVSFNNRSSSGNNIIYFETGSNKYNEYVRGTNFSSVSAFTEYLSENNLILYYIKNTPTTTQITDETLISQLDAIENAMSTTDTTTITQTNSDLPFIITASALTTIASASNE